MGKQMAAAMQQAAQPAKAAQPPATVTNIGDAKKRDRKPRDPNRKQLFSQKAKYDGPTASLTLYVREQTGGSFATTFVVQKKGGKKEKGVVKAYPNKQEAVAAYDAYAAKCLANGWALATTVTKSAYDDIPMAV